MPSLGIPEIVTLIVVALLVFGPERLPGIARTVGQTIGKFKAEAQGTLDELKRQAELDDLKDVAAEFKSTRDDLRRSASLTGPVASGARPSESTTSSTVVADGPPAFDPDAT